jgi:hypothetical protein
MKVSWQVTAQRNDAYVIDHPFEAVQMKPERKKGLYLYPKAVGENNSKLYLTKPSLNEIVQPDGAKTEQKPSPTLK